MKQLLTLLAITIFMVSCATAAGPQEKATKQAQIKQVPQQKITLTPEQELIYLRRENASLKLKETKAFKDFEAANDAWQKVLKQIKKEQAEGAKKKGGKKK